MRYFWLLVLAIIPFNSLASQEDDVSYRELLSWQNEMVECIDVDPAYESFYTSTVNETAIAKSVRLLHFATRHNLYNQFLAEDAQGKR